MYTKQDLLKAFETVWLSGEHPTEAESTAYNMLNLHLRSLPDTPHPILTLEDNEDGGAQLVPVEFEERAKKAEGKFMEDVERFLCMDFDNLPPAVYVALTAVREQARAEVLREVGK